NDPIFDFLQSITDSGGRVLSFEQYDTLSGGPKVIKEGASEPIPRTSSIQYDMLGRPSSVTSPDGYQQLFMFDLGGRLTSVERKMTSGTSSPDETLAITPDGDGRPVRIAGPRSTQQLTYDPSGNLVRIVESPTQSGDQTPVRKTCIDVQP